MKKSSRLLPPILAIILTVILTLVLVLHHAFLVEETLSGDQFRVIYVRLVNGINTMIAFIVGGCGFISLLISVKWLIESINATKQID